MEQYPREKDTTTAMQQLRRLPSDLFPITISLRTKALVLVGTMAALLIAVLFALGRTMLLNSFTALEKEEVTQDAERVIGALENNLISLNQITMDWAYWDDTYEFVRDQNADYIASNLLDETFTTLDINLILYFDLSGRSIFAKAYDPYTNQSFELTPWMVQFYLTVNSSLLLYEDYALQQGGAAGFILTPMGPTMLAIQPILPSRMNDEPRGVLVFGRSMDQARVEQLAQITAVNFTLLYVHDPALPASYREPIQRLLAGADTVSVPLDDDTFASYALIDDVLGEPRWVMRVEMARDISHKGRDVVWAFLAAATLLALALIGAIAGLMERLVLARLFRISHAIRRINQTGDLAGRVPVNGNDELADLGYIVNDLLAAFGRSQEVLHTSQEQLSVLYQQADLRADELARVAAISHQITRIFDAEAVPWEVSRLIHEEFDFAHVFIFLLDGETLKLAAGIQADMQGLDLAIPLNAVPSLVARSARTRETVLANDVSQEPDFLRVNALSDTRSELVIPMIVGGELIGVLNIEDNQLNRFTPDDAHIQAMLAAQVAIAIHNARLFTENARRLAIIENTNSLVALADLDTFTPHYINPAGLELLGYERPEDVLSRSVQSNYPPEALERLRRDALPAVRATGMWRGESEFRRADGRVVPVEQTLFAIPDKNSRARDIATIAIDITARQQAEQALRAANRAYRVLSDCNQAMVRATDEACLLDDVCRIIVGTGHYPFAWVNYPDRVDGRFRMRPAASAGNNDGYLETISTLRREQPDLPPGPSRRALLTNETQIIADIATDPSYVYWRDEMLARGYQSMIALPLSTNGQTFGTLNVYAAEPDAFDEQEIVLLNELADDLAYGITALRTQIERQHVLDQLQQANARLEKRHAELFALQEIAQALISTLDIRQIYEVIYREMAQGLLGAQHLVVARYDPEHEQIVCDYSVVDGEPFDVTQLPPVPFGDGPNSETIRTRQPRIIALPTARNTVTLPGTYTRVGTGPDSQSSLYLPLVSGNTVLGVLNIQHNDADAFHDADMKLLMIIANQAAVAIRNAQLYNAEHQQREFAEALTAMATVLTGVVSVDEVVSHVLDHMERVVPHDAANIMLVDADRTRGEVIGARGYESRGGKQTHRMSLVDLAHVEPGQSIIISDTVTDPRWTDFPQDRWIRSFLGTPIHLSGQIVGMLNLDSATPGAFTPAHAGRVQAFADQIALAIRSAQLFESVQRHAAELEQRVYERTQELEQQRAQLQAILDSMGEGVIYDENRQIRYINRALTQLTGYEVDEFAAQPYLEPLCQATLTPDERERLIRQIYDSVEQHNIWQGEARLQRRDGDLFDAALTVTSVRNAAGQPTGVVTVIRDISKEKELQAQRVRFIANASHELRTPLANFKTRLYLLQRQPEKAELHHQILSRVTNNMAELVENLLDVSRFERGVIPLNRRVVALQELIRGVTDVQQTEAEAKQIHFEISLYPTRLCALVDARRMAQVINNLVANAINYTPEGGHIRVELEPDGPHVVLRVRDTGIGIAPDMIGHVFEPFFRADEKVTVGTGLGLTIAREIVNLHGSEIAVDSTRGEGSVFSVRLDLVSENG